jgi:protein ImuB
MEVACVLVSDPELRAAGEARRLPREDIWEDELRALEGIGAALESERPGEAFFALGGLRGLHGGRRADVVAAALGAMRLPAGIAVAPTRFAAFAAARAGAGTVTPERLRDLLDPLPVAALLPRLGLGEREGEDLAETLRRLGLGTLGALAALSPARVADSFGPPPPPPQRL